MSGDYNQYQKPTSKDSLQVKAEKNDFNPDWLCACGAMPVAEPPNPTNTVVGSEKREWVPLTDDEILAIVFDAKITEPNDEPIKFGAPSRKCIKDLVSCVEAKLKEKNT